MLPTTLYHDLNMPYVRDEIRKQPENAKKKKIKVPGRGRET